MTQGPADESRTIAGRYRIDGRLGAGAFAITWRATDLNLQRTVAIKELRAELASDRQFRVRFEREAQAAAAVSSEHTVQIFDVGHEGESAYIVMEYVDGGSLRDLMDESGGSLGVARSLDLIRQVLRGLEAIHARGIVHRDLKPENVLIGNDGIARIADFGIASVGDQVGLTTTGTTFGTAAYMAPEQGRGEPVTPATDLYAAGVMLFEILTGRLPFRASTIVAMLMAHQNDPPPALTDELPGYPGLSDVIRQAMAKEPGRRFRSAGAMIAALDEPSAPARTTRVMPTPTVQRTEAMPVAPVPRGMATPVPTRRPQAYERRGGGLGWLWTVLILVLVGAGGTYAAMAYFDDEQNNPLVPVVTRTPTDEADDEVIDEPDPTDTPVQIIEPIDTETPEPDPTDTEEPEPTDEPTDTPEPTATDDPEPTEPDPTEPGVIEPIDATPTETSTPDPDEDPDFDNEPTITGI
ncbi:MAG: protein kinase [Chloroflexota bacterium]|nr:protein kinase [Chloroflexota bacterium]